jgi:hypothetical protein
MKNHTHGVRSTKPEQGNYINIADRPYVRAVYAGGISAIASENGELVDRMERTLGDSACKTYSTLNFATSRTSTSMFDLFSPLMVLTPRSGA